MRPNLVLIVFDTARADAFEPYGAPIGSSPVVADLARDGGFVPGAEAPASWTVPSHAAMFTGRLPRAVGLGQSPGGSVAGVRARLAEQHQRLLPEVLRGSGYVTAGASCNAWISPAGGWDLGFDEFTLVPSRRARPSRGDWRRTARWLHQAVVAEIDDGAREVEHALVDWLSRWDGADPFFWFVNLVECHAPYLPPRPWTDLSVLERVRAAVDNHRYQSYEAVVRQNVQGLQVPPAAMDRMRHLYGRAIGLLDAWLGRVLSHLEARGVLDDTVVLVTSDHGEHFGEGGRLGHALSLSNQLLRVPVVARGPVDLPDRGPWSLTGLPEVLARAAGLDDPPFEPAPAGSVVAAQFDELATREDPAVIDLRDRWGLTDLQVRRLTDPLTSVSDGRFKVVQCGDERWAHDLSQDLEEVRRLPVDHAPERLRRAIEDPVLWEVPTREADAVSSPPGATVDPDDVAMLEEQMRLLGYL